MHRRPVLGLFLVFAALTTLLCTLPASAQVDTLRLTVDRPSPQMVGTSMTFTATATGGSGVYEYKFWVARGAGAWVAVTPQYVPGRTFVWTPTAVDRYDVRVYVRNVGSTATKEKFAVVRNYYIVAEAPVTAVELGANLTSPRQVGTPVTFTAEASVAGVVGTHEYQFWLYSKLSGAYRLVKDYPVSGNSWTATSADMGVADSYKVKVNARNVGSIAPLEKYAIKDYVMTGYVPLRPVTLSADQVPPQNLATVGTVTFTAAAQPGAPGDAVEYRFWLATAAGAPYVAVGDVTTGYSASNSWHWTPAAAGSYQVMVYARTVGRTVAYERFRTLPYEVFALPPTLGAVTPPVQASPAGETRIFSVVYSDPDGYGDLRTAGLLVNATPGGADGICVGYDSASDSLTLLDDAGTAPVGTCSPGSSGTLSNSRGTLNCGATSVSGSGADLTIDWSITPGAALVGGTALNVYTRAQDAAGAQVGWEDGGDWTITSSIDLANCPACHGNPPHAGIDGVPGTDDDAPSVMGDGDDADGTGSTPKPYDDGTWGFNVNGHGANGTAANTPGQESSPGVAYLTPDLACTACHDISLPAAGTGMHLNGILNSVEGKSNPSANTAHLRTDGTYPFIVAGSTEHSVQVGVDLACYMRCHQSAAVPNMRHARDSILAPAPGHETNFNNVLNAVRFGDKGTVADGESIPYPIDTALTTNASSAPDDFAACISCHNPHGTQIVESQRATNRMVRDGFVDQDTLCRTCHR